MRTAGGVVLSSAGAGRAAEADTLDLDSLAAWPGLALIIPFPCAVSPIHGVDFDRPSCLLPPAARAGVG
jgi:hypothetical protein